MQKNPSSPDSQAMRDQAAQLRRLVQLAAHGGSVSPIPAPRVVAVFGGKSGAGATTVAVNLAVASSQDGSRVVLIDANPVNADVASLCGVQADWSINDIFAARRDVHEVLVRGPAGIQLVPGAAPHDLSKRGADKRLLRQIQGLGRHADLVLIDLGQEIPDHLQEICTAASELLVVTTPDDDSVVNTYTALKQGSAGARSRRILINRAASADSAREVYSRIQRSCRRFLGSETTWGGWIPEDPRVKEAEQARASLVVAHRDSAASLAFEAAAASLRPYSAPTSRAA